MVAAAVVAAATAVACGGDAGDPDRLSSCPTEALDEASEDGPVEIELWHTMTPHSGVLAELTNEFNRSQDRVRVDLVDNRNHEDQQERYREGLETGDLPDVVQHEESWFQQMVDTRSALPVQSCIDATGFDTGDFVDRALRYYELDGVQWALPFNVTTPVLLYNRDVFARAGLDPDDPPTTLEELRDAAEAIRDAGLSAGVSLKVDGWLFEQLLALDGELFVDHANGRDGRATEVAFDSETGEDVFSYLADMVESGAAVTNPKAGPGQFDNLLGVGAGRWGMAIDSSAALGNVLDVLQSSDYADADLAVAPMPGRTPTGGVSVGGGALYISATDGARQAAAWEYMTFLTSPESQARWASATGYVPVRESAAEMAEVETSWAEVPGLRSAYDQLVDSADNSATAGPVMGDLGSVRTLVEQAESRMFLQGQDPADALAEAAQAADDVVEDYNARIGA